MTHEGASELPGLKNDRDGEARESAADIARKVEEGSEGLRRKNVTLKRMLRAAGHIARTPKRKRLGV